MFLDPFGDGGTLLQDTLQKIKIARLATETATVRCFMVCSKGPVYREPQDSAAAQRCLSVLDNYEPPPARIVVRFGDDSGGWPNTRRRLFRFQSKHELCPESMLPKPRSQARNAPTAGRLERDHSGKASRGSNDRIIAVAQRIGGDVWR
jgi:hypothetical protein